MKRVRAAIILAGSVAAAVLACAPLLAAAPEQPIAAKQPLAVKQPIAAKRLFAREVIGCMKTRMRADRRLSYNQAAKDCKEYVARQPDGRAREPLVASD